MWPLKLKLNKNDISTSSDRILFFFHGICFSSLVAMGNLSCHWLIKCVCVCGGRVENSHELPCHCRLLIFFTEVFLVQFFTNHMITEVEKIWFVAMGTKWFKIIASKAIWPINLKHNKKDVSTFLYRIIVCIANAATLAMAPYSFQWFERRKVSKWQYLLSHCKFKCFIFPVAVCLSVCLSVMDIVSSW